MILNSLRQGAGTAAGAAQTLNPGDASIVARYAALPYLAAALFGVFIGFTGDRTGERRWHIAGCFLLSATGFVFAAKTGSFAFGIAAFTLAAMGLWSIMGPFWALPTRELGGQAAAGGVAIITMVGGIGGFTGPYLTGRLRDLTHGFAGGLYTIAGACILAALLCFALRGSEKQPN